MTRVRSAVGLVIVVLVLMLGAAAAVAQDSPSSQQVPTQDIVPQPNTGDAPSEAGDRGGALQLLIPAVLVLAIGGGVWHVSRQARRGGSPG